MKPDDLQPVVRKGSASYVMPGSTLRMEEKLLSSTQSITVRTDLRMSNGRTRTRTA